MPSDDRDRQLEKALARHLRGTSGDSACPDAEILAAYHERTLSLEEMAQWKQHIAACSRCQETLALVEESNVVHGSEEEEKRKMMELVGGRLAAASRMPVEEALPASLPVRQRSATIQKPKRAAALRWVVPVGALAAGLLVWVAVRENHQNLITKSSQMEVAENRETTANTPAISPPPPAPSSRDRQESMVPPPEALKEPRKDNVAPPAKSSGALEEKAPTGGAMSSPTVTPADKKEGEAGLRSTGELSVPKSEAVPAPPAEIPNYAAQTRELPPTQRMQAPVPAASNAAAAKQAANTGRLLGQQNQNQKAKVQSQVAENLEVSAASGGSQSLNDVLPQGGVIIVAPVDAYSWRVGLGGKIEHSTDSSRTWRLQKSGVTTDLTAGSAPSGKVCWVVGKAGTVLLTTDRGSHWKQLASPTKEDLAGVDAMDAKRASIWTVSHKQSFDTNDGGATWTPVVNK
jgi:hypothetical protein